MSTKTLAFFGAGGDSAGFCLAAALKAGYHCSALARTPAKLSASMTAKGVSQETQDRHLTIIQGDIRNSEAVERTLVICGAVVDIVVSGVGATAVKFVFSLYPMVLADETICRDAMSTILAALRTVTAGSTAKKPLLTPISTTGIPAPGKPRDIPLLWIPFYKWLLHSPHVDKEVMDSFVRQEVRKPESERAIRASVTVRPSFFAGSTKGWQSLRVGTDDEPARGYFTERKDVGEWMFEKLVKGEPERQWINGGVHLTH
ncbi:hypothetical protein B0A48_05901 [Cryoendolithus antarcticus]|uniref:Uncharacterized protein n=1 Tax=Cryoendolithus antarcticus TaxID=1507870 RepID=A0A1V8TCB2_9PEZI|nr:hypothetical protein B0A48_05901 [Cryoendolithus antarcticus]